MKKICQSLLKKICRKFFEKNNLSRTKIILLEFLPYKNYNQTKLQKIVKGGGRMGKGGRPKAEIPRFKRLECRLTNFEYEKISRLAEKLKISKTEAVVRGINLLERDKPKKFKNLSGNNKKISDGVIDGEVVMFNK